MSAAPAAAPGAARRRPARRGGWRIPLLLVASVAVVAALLRLPPSRLAPPQLSAGRPFVWGEDDLWQALERRFAAARASGCAARAPEIDAALGRGRALVGALAGHELPPEAAVYGEIEWATFDLAPDVAACPVYLREYLALAGSLRAAVKQQSRHWDLGSRPARDRLYRLLYGSRAAVEEAILQAPAGAVPGLVLATDEPSATPSAAVHGVTVHSGDVLVSRGGAPTSALIARGNDYPGNFSHVALLHVDTSGHLAIVEAHIERGVVVSTAEEYLRDVKLRIMLLRPRTDLAALRADPLLPDRAAAEAMEQAHARHIPYDFAMDFRDHHALFCSEVASAAYEREGVTLWSGLSHISSPGLAAWLAAFGVRHFVTEEPSDLEYDPQLTVVAEWRDPDVLFRDHVDNAVVDVLLEHAEHGRRLGYPAARLPFARLAKAYSVALNLVGSVGPVPEGMSAASALRSQRLDEIHAALAGDVLAAAARFTVERGRRPPYWTLVQMARDACVARRCDVAL
jgi:hypothetical protein